MAEVPSRLLVSDHRQPEGTSTPHDHTGGRCGRACVASPGLDDLRDRSAPGPWPQDHPRLSARGPGRRAAPTGRTGLPPSTSAASIRCGVTNVLFGLFRPDESVEPGRVMAPGIRRGNRTGRASCPHTRISSI